MSGQKELGGKPDILVTSFRGNMAALSSIHLVKLEIFAALPLRSASPKADILWGQGTLARSFWPYITACDLETLDLAEYHVIALSEAGYCQVPTAWPLFKEGRQD